MFIEGWLRVAPSEQPHGWRQVHLHCPGPDPLKVGIGILVPSAALQALGEVYQLNTPPGFSPECASGPTSRSRQVAA